MRSRRHAARLLQNCARGLLALGVVVGGLACAESPAPDEPGRIEISVDLLTGTRWEAQGALVDAGSMCDHGTRYLLWRADPATGRSIDSRELDQLTGAGSPTGGLDVRFVYEYVCDDGRGSFVAAEHPATNGWTVVYGRGAFSRLAGDGTRSLVHDLNAQPSEVFVLADVDVAAEQWTGIFNPWEIDS